MVRLTTLAVMLAAAACAVPSGVAADDRREVRVRGDCTGASDAELRLRADDVGIRIDFEVENRGRATSWRVVVVHERRIAWRGTRATARGSDLRIRRTVADWFGTDTISVRATAARGETCRAAAAV